MDDSSQYSLRVTCYYLLVDKHTFSCFRDKCFLSPFFKDGHGLAVYLVHKERCQ
jgi:hypothetical protein